MMRSAKLLTAIVVAILVLPHPRSFAKSRTLLPDLTVDLFDGTSFSCAGPSLLRLSITFAVRNIGTGTAVSPSPIYQWVVIGDTGGGPPVPELTWSAGGADPVTPEAIPDLHGATASQAVPRFCHCAWGLRQSSRRD